MSLDLRSIENIVQGIRPVPGDRNMEQTTHLVQLFRQGPEVSEERVFLVHRRCVYPQRVLLWQTCRDVLFGIQLRA